MLEIKIQCPCGQRYKFDVEPIEGRMPFVVNCPICGLEGTSNANEVLGKVLVAEPLPAPAAASGPMRVGLALPTSVEGSLAPPRAPVGRGQLQTAAASTAQKKPSFGLGLLGALVGTLLGSIVYFLTFNYTGVRLKLLAIGVGYLAGLGAEVLGRKEGSKQLGMIAGVFTLVGVVSAQYCVARNWWNTAQQATPKMSGYAASVLEAKKTIAAVPTGSEQEIRVLVARMNAAEGDKPDPTAVSSEEIKEFRDQTLPRMRDLASGKLTRLEFEKEQQQRLAQKKSRDRI